MQSQQPDDQVRGGIERSAPQPQDVPPRSKPYEPPPPKALDYLAEGLEIDKSTRKRMAARCQPLLPEEQIDYILYCQRHSPYAMALLPAQPRVIAVTRDHVWIIRVGTTWMNVLLGPMPSFLAPPKGIIAKLPRDTLIGPVSGLTGGRGLMWGRATINGERLWIPRRFFKDVEAADEKIK